MAELKAVITIMDGDEFKKWASGVSAKLEEKDAEIASLREQLKREQSKNEPDMFWDADAAEHSEDSIREILFDNFDALEIAEIMTAIRASNVFAFITYEEETHDNEEVHIFNTLAEAQAAAQQLKLCQESK